MILTATVLLTNPHICPFFFKDFIYLFLGKGEGRKKQRETNINVRLLLGCPLPGTLPATQACALTRNQTSNPLALRPTLNPLSPTSQGICLLYYF